MADKITEQKLQSTMPIIRQLLIENNLDDWQIKINRKRSAIAQTDHEEKTFYFSKYFLIVANKHQLVGITLHEIAHALLGAGNGHNDEFIRLCIKISPDASYACPSVNIPIRRYIAICPNCGYKGSCNNTKLKYCSACFEKGKIVKFDMKLNDIQVVQL